MNKTLLTTAMAILFSTTAQAEIYGSFKQQINFSNTTRTDMNGNDATYTSDNVTERTESDDKELQKAPLDQRNYTGTDVRLGFKGNSILNDGLDAGYKLELQTTENKNFTIYESNVYITGNFGKVSVGPLRQGAEITSAYNDTWVSINPFKNTFDYSMSDSNDQGGKGIGYTAPNFIENMQVVLNLGSGRDSGKSSFIAQIGLSVIYVGDVYKVSIASDSKKATATEKQAAASADDKTLTVDPSSSIVLAAQYTYENFIFGFTNLTGTRGSNMLGEYASISAYMLDALYKHNRKTKYRLGFGNRSESVTIMKTTKANIGFEALFALGKSSDIFFGYTSSKESNNVNKKTVNTTVSTIGVSVNF